MLTGRKKKRNTINGNNIKKRGESYKAHLSSVIE